VAGADAQTRAQAMTQFLNEHRVPVAKATIRRKYPKVAKA